MAIVAGVFPPCFFFFCFFVEEGCQARAPLEKLHHYSALRWSSSKAFNCCLSWVKTLHVSLAVIPGVLIIWFDMCIMQEN